MNIPTIRRIILGVVLFFSIIVLAVSAVPVALFAAVSIDLAESGGTSPLLALSISILTAVLVIVILSLSGCCGISKATMLAVECGWSGLMWVLWLATAGLATTQLVLCGGGAPPSLDGGEFGGGFGGGFGGRVGGGFGGGFGGGLGISNPVGGGVCAAWQTMVALSFLNWLLLMGWFITLIVFGVRGNHWMSNLDSLDLNSPRPNNDSAQSSTMQKSAADLYIPSSQQYPPQQYQAQQYPPQQYPQQPQQGTAPAIHV